MCHVSYCRPTSNLEHLLLGIDKVEALITDKSRESLHMFRRSNSKELFFLRKETTSKENAPKKQKNKKQKNHYKFRKHYNHGNM